MKMNKKCNFIPDGDVDLNEPDCALCKNSNWFDNQKLNKRYLICIDSGTILHEDIIEGEYMKVLIKCNDCGIKKTVESEIIYNDTICPNDGMCVDCPYNEICEDSYMFKCDECWKGE